MRSNQAGFTLIELMVVLAITAIVIGGVAMAMPSSPHRELGKDAQLLANSLEAARAVSRSNRTTLVVDVRKNGFIVTGIGQSQLNQWQSPDTQAQPIRVLVGPEALIPESKVYLSGAEGAQYIVKTDGVAPFHFVSEQ